MKWLWFCLLPLTACNGTKVDQKIGEEIPYIKMPPGFHIEVYADSVEDARSMSLSPKGTLYVGTRDNDKVYVIRDEDGDLLADKKYVIATERNSPNGVVFHKGDLFFAEIDKIWKLPDIEAYLTDPPPPVLISDQYPDDGHHGWKYIAFGPDDKLYIPVGAPCNICLMDDSIYSSITRMNADGSGMEIFASGIRNTVGFTWHPKTHEMWFTDNGRDMMGDSLPPDELNCAPHAGMHFGYPYCHGGFIPDTKIEIDSPCAHFEKPRQLLGAHVAALGVEFVSGKMFPKEYQGALLIAEHGSWNRTDPLGYRITLVRLDDAGNAISYEVFAEGWLQGRQKLGRPVDLEWMPDGSLLVSDDYADKIYRIWYGK